MEIIYPPLLHQRLQLKATFPTLDKLQLPLRRVEPSCAACTQGKHHLLAELPSYLFMTGPSTELKTLAMPRTRAYGTRRGFTIEFAANSIVALL